MRKRFIGLAAVYMLIPAMLLGQPAGKKELVGVWAAKEAPVEQSQSPLLSLAMFGGEGSFTNGRWIQGASTCSRGSGLGDRDRPRVWPMGRHGGKEFQLTYYSVLWKEGLVNGFQRVQGTLALTESGDEYTGRAQVDFLDANWNVVFSTTRDVKGARLETPIPATIAAQPAERMGVWEKKAGRGAGLPGPPILGLVLSRDW